MSLEKIVNGDYLNEYYSSHDMPGIYIAFEGIARSGKSTQIKLIRDYLMNKYPDKEILLIREPGEGEIGRDLRKVIQENDYTNPSMTYVTEAYGYAMDRSQTLRTVVKPALDRGAIVLSDRTYISSLAFQGGGRELGVDTIYEINKVAVGNITPNLVMYIDLPVEIALKRNLDIDGDKHEKEGPEYHKRIRETYLKLSQRPELKDKWRTIDGQGSVEVVYNRIEKALNDFLHHHD